MAAAAPQQPGRGQQDGDGGGDQGGGLGPFGRRAGQRQVGDEQAHGEPDPPSRPTITASAIRSLPNSRSAAMPTGTPAANTGEVMGRPRGRGTAPHRRSVTAGGEPGTQVAQLTGGADRAGPPRHREGLKSDAGRRLGIMVVGVRLGQLRCAVGTMARRGSAGATSRSALTAEPTCPSWRSWSAICARRNVSESPAPRRAPARRPRRPALGSTRRTIRTRPPAGVSAPDRQPDTRRVVGGPVGHRDRHGCVAVPRGSAHPAGCAPPEPPAESRSGAVRGTGH